MHSASAGISLHLEHGTLEPIAVDGHGLVDPATPAAAGFGILYPGERLDLVLDKTTSFSQRGGETSAANILTVELDDRYVDHASPFIDAY